MDDSDELFIRIEVPPSFRTDYPDAYAEIRAAIQSGALVIDDPLDRPGMRYVGRTPAPRPDPPMNHVVILHEDTDDVPPRQRRRLPRDPDTLTFTVAEAGAKLGISRALAYDAVRAGQIPSIQIGRRILVPKAALLRLLDAPSTDQ